MNLFKNLLKLPWIVCFRSSRSYSNHRLRFAPSPTGRLHLGGLRTAIYNYMFAKKNNGVFVLRIEDTDQKRKVPGAVQHMEDILTWAGIVPDEGPNSGGSYGPYIQSERLHLYKAPVQKLIEKGAAYRCFCTDRQLEIRRKEAFRNHQTPRYDNRCRFLTKEEISEKLSCNQSFSIRFKLNDQLLTFYDMIHGSVTMNISISEGDPIILKSDGYPTYHLANVVDDHLMNISHVLRGMEWQISTFKHIMMYNALNWAPPHFAHLPLILNSDGTKLSKRQNDIHIQHLKDSGYFPEAVLNYVIHIGGIEHKHHSPSLQELINEFDLKNINSSSCRMEENVLETCNRNYLVKHLDSSKGIENLIEVVKKLVCKYYEDEKVDASVDIPTNDYIRRVLFYHKNLISNVMELLEPSNAYLWSRPSLNITNIQHLGPDTVEILKEITNHLQQFTEDQSMSTNLAPIFKNICEKKNVKFSHCMKLLRRILCGVKDGPPIADVIQLLDLQESVSRIHKAISLLESEQTCVQSLI